MKYKISFTNQEITPWSGLGFLRQMMHKLDFRRKISDCNVLPKPGSNRGYFAIDIIESFIVSIWCGANRFLHTEITRHDSTLNKIFGWKRVPGNDTYKRFFRKFNYLTSSRFSDHLFGWVFKNITFDRFTLDCDSSILTRYGTKQEGAKRGYNPKKPGRDSHHPLLAFVNDLKLVANFWLRQGNTHTSNNFAAFLDDTLQKLSGKKVGLIRLDSGFYSKDVMELLENKVIDYIMAVKFYVPIQKMVSLQQAWLSLDDGIEICDTEYQSSEWDKPRRMVVVRQHIKERPQAVGKPLNIFEGTQYYYRYRYTAYITNMNLPSAEIWRLYRQRADSENRIKELKEDFGFESFNLKDFYATEAALTVTMLAYNLMSLFRMFVLKSEIQHKLSTLRYKVFAIGAYFGKNKGQYILKIALAKQRRKWFTGLWNASNQLKLPFDFSNA
jgi:hypothetical protein